MGGAFAVDIETNGLLRPEPGRSRLLDRVHCAAAAPLEGGRVLRFHDDPALARDGSLADFLRLVSTADLVVGHGAIDFDVPALERVYPDWRLDLPAACESRRLVDTLVLARVRFPWIRETDMGRIRRGFPTKLIGSHSLEAWGHRIGHHKGSFSALADENPDLWAVLSEDMMTYCAGDAAVTADLYHKLLSGAPLEQVLPRALPLEQSFAHQIGRMMNTGVEFDMSGAIRLAATLRDKVDALDASLAPMLGVLVKEWETPIRKEPRRKETPVNPGSRSQVAEVLVKRYGWRPKRFGQDGIPALDEDIIDALPESVPPELRAGLSMRFTLTKRLGQVADGKNALVKMALDIGGDRWRIFGYVNHCGAHTSRCTHRNPNTANIPRVGSLYGRECRELFTASPGMELVGADMSSVEARAIAHYLVKYDGGAFRDKVSSGADFHADNAAAAGLARTPTKNTLYAVCYGALDKKVAAMNGVPLKRGAEIRKILLDKIPGLERLIEDVQETATERGYLIGLDGRRLRPRRAFSALNTLVQGAGAIVMKRATSLAGMALLGQARLVLHVHDEYQWETEVGRGEDVGQVLVGSIEQAGRDLNVLCPMTGGFKRGRTWADTH